MSLKRMAVSLDGVLVIGVSSRALFDLSAENAIFAEQGLEAYECHQLQNEEKILNPGPAFSLVKALLQLNAHFPGERLVEVVVMSRNAAETSLRIFNSISHYGLDIPRAALTGGAPLAPYLQAFNVGLFLSQHEEDVVAAADAGFAAATLYTRLADEPTQDIHEIRIAFDGDAVLFSEESERVFQEKGLEAFIAHEVTNAENPMGEGPFAKFLRAIALLQSRCKDRPVIRTALVTARSGPAHERAIRTLRAWGIDVNEAFFLGGLPKGKILKAFGAHMFFDDHKAHCDDAAQYVPTGLVPSKVREGR